ncbi:hypothetical protein NHQ30_008248 [Ciborinia camelliae]|nr:hypothetical protein NHQ30_008248 [Ciborinia camelliae]
MPNSSVFLFPLERNMNPTLSFSLTSSLRNPNRSLKRPIWSGKAGRGVGGKRAGEQESRRAGEQESRRAGEQESRRAGEQESRRAGEQESRRAGEQESRRAGEQWMLLGIKLPHRMERKGFRIVLGNCIKVMRATGDIGVPGLYVPSHTGESDSNSGQGMLLISLGKLSEEWVPIGTGKCNVKAYSRYLRDMIIQGVAKSSFVAWHQTGINEAPNV